MSKTVKATQSWKVVFVSQDGPKGHENIAPQDCPGVIWCHMWDVAQQAGQELGISMELAYVKEDCDHEDQCVRQQIKLINDLVERGGIHGLIIGPRDSNLLVPVIEKAIAAKIAVIAVGTPINSDNVLTLVTFDDFEGGKTVGQWVANQLKRQGNVLILEGPKYQKNALERRHGFIAGLQEQDITILDTETALWSCQKAQAVTQKWLEEYENIDAIIAASDHMALGALIASIRQQRNILITGYDAIPEAKAAIESEKLGATIEQLPSYQSQTSVNLMIRHLETGETFPKVVYLPKLPLLTKTNLPKSSTDTKPFDIKGFNCSF